MKDIITTKSIFTDSRFEISISDSILEDGLVLEVINMEEPKQNIRLELNKSEIRQLCVMLKDLGELSNYYLEYGRNEEDDFEKNNLDSEIK